MAQDFNQEMTDERMSKINSAGIMNITLENLWRDYNSAMSDGRYQRANSKLDSIWVILAGDVKENGDEEKRINNINIKIYEQGSMNTKTGTGFQKVVNPKSPLVYQYLILKAVFLRRLQNKQGKGTSYISEDEDDFD